MCLVSCCIDSIHVHVAPKEGELVTGKRVFQRGKRDGPLKDDEEEEEESDVEALVDSAKGDAVKHAQNVMAKHVE